MNFEIYREKQRLEIIFQQIRDVDEPEMMSHWAKYLCILTSGYIENVIRLSLLEYCSKHSSPSISKYMSKQINRLTNLKCSKINALLSEFDQDWSDLFDKQITKNDELKDAIDSVIANRHLIAHGRNIGITYITIKSYYKRVDKAMAITYSIINNLAEINPSTNVK